MLLNEFLKEHRKVQDLEKQVAALTAGLQKVAASLASSRTETTLNDRHHFQHSRREEPVSLPLPSRCRRWRRSDGESLHSRRYRINYPQVRDSPA
jgi:hypothetical protein